MASRDGPDSRGRSLNRRTPVAARTPNVRILFVTADLGFPPRTGPQTQTLTLLKYLLEQGHECRLLALHRRNVAVDLRGLQNEMPRFQVAALLSWKYDFAIETLMALAPKLPGLSGRRKLIESAMMLALNESSPDIVHLEGIALAPYVTIAAGTPTVLSLTDAISLMQRRLAGENPSALGKIYRWLAARLALGLERRALPRATIVQVVSKVDRDYLCSEVPGAEIEHIGLAVPPETLALDDRNSEENQGRHLFFSSDLRAGHLRRGLLWFLSEVYPKVTQAFPDVHLTVVGGGAQTAVMQEAFARVSGVTSASWVDDYDAQLRGANVVIVPDPCGGGAKNRVLRAMALRRPVVGTPSAFEGIAIEDGVGGFSCRTAEEFANSVVALLGDHSLRTRVGEAARQCAESIGIALIVAIVMRSSFVQA